MARTIDANNVKLPPRKVIDDELNQTMPISVKKDKAKANDIILAPPKTRDGRSELPKERRAFHTIDVDTSLPLGSAEPQNQQRVGQKQIEMMKHNRIAGAKQSVSPDKYQINSNLVVHLADPIKKNDVNRKIQAQNKTTGQAQKATFFPSTATSTTGASSGGGS